MLSGDWVAATLSFLSAAATVGGICFRNFGAPRLVAVMIFLSLGPCCLGAVLAGKPTLWITLLQIPFYLFAMSAAAWRLNGMLVSTMKAELENDRRARHDELTGLLNRAGLFAAMRSREPGARHGYAGGALLYLDLDLDGFKAVNDAYGHESGDEFVMLTPPCTDPFALADTLVRELGKPFHTDGELALNIGASVGIAMFDRDHNELDGVLRDANNALYEAKRAGKRRWGAAHRTFTEASSPLSAALPRGIDTVTPKRQVAFVASEAHQSNALSFSASFAKRRHSSPRRRSSLGSATVSGSCATSSTCTS